MPESGKRAAGAKVAFGDVVQLSNERSKDPIADGLERFIGLEHLEGGDLNVRNWGEISEGVTFTSIFHPGQTLFGKRRAYQRKVAVADFDGVCSSDIYVLKPKGDQLIPELLPFICQSESFLEYVISMSQGGLSPRVNWQALATYEFVLPSLEEQRRISTALRAIQGAESSISRLEREFKRMFRMSIGRMLRLEATKKPELKDVPDGWSVARLDELTDPGRPISYGILKPGDEDPHGVAMLRVLDFDDFGDRTATVPSKVARGVAETSKTTYVREGDVLVSVMATVGRAFLVPEQMTGWNVNRALAVLPAGERVSGAYIETFLQSDFVQRVFDISQIGSAQSRINLEFLRALRVPVAPAEIQTCVVEQRQQLGASLRSIRARQAEIRHLKMQVLEGALS